MRPMLLTVLLACALPLHAQDRATEPYRITHTYVLGGDGFWDYVTADAASRRLFIGRQNRLMVVDENDGKLLGEIKGLGGAHGAAVAPGTGRGFATAGEDAAVVVFDLETLQRTGSIPAGDDADAIIYDAASRRVFSFNGDANTATAIDPQSVKAIANIELGGKPESAAAALDGKVYVNLVDKAEVVEIDAAAARVTRRWSTAPCMQPVAMAIDVAHHRVFSGCRSRVLAISDYDAGKVVATVPIGTGVDGAGFDAASADVFTSNGDGTLTVIHEDAPDRYRVVQTLETAPGARTLGFDPATRRVFVVAAKLGAAPAGGRRGQVLPGTFEVLVIERAAGPG
jgi:DNA-binding beta-propeller fold protein YncE